MSTPIRKRFIQALIAVALLMLAGPVANGNAFAENWSDEKIEAYNHDPGQAGEAAWFAEKRWPRQFAGYWIERGKAESRWGKVRVFVFAFTREPAAKVRILRKRFRLNDSWYRAARRPHTFKLLKRTMNRVSRDAERAIRRKLRLPDGHRHLFATLSVHERSNSVRITRPWTGRTFRRWVRQRYDGLVTVQKGDFPTAGLAQNRR